MIKEVYNLKRQNMEHIGEVAHYKGLEGETRKIQWCYIGKQVPKEITSQLITQ